MFQRFKDFYKANGRWIPVLFFILGFIFDAFMLKRVDELLTIVQQFAYIAVSAYLIRLEILEGEGKLHAPRLLSKVWAYREALLHFLMGTLLNAYTIFYFKSASALTSFIFIALLVGLLILNEFGRFGKSQTQVHMALLSLCLISFLVTLAPILLGFIGLIPFLAANAAAALIFWAYSRWLKPTFSDVGFYRKNVEWPFISILGVFAALYFLHAIPPVPLSVSFIGIYHNVQKVEGQYELSALTERTWLSKNGDRDFLARPGDSVYCFVRIFSPARFKDQLQVRWLQDIPGHGWKTSDVVPLPIVGGREQGFRGMTKKSNYQPGSWRVQVETAEGREVGRINFKIEADGESSERTFITSLE